MDCCWVSRANRRKLYRIAIRTVKKDATRGTGICERESKPAG